MKAEEALKLRRIVDPPLLVSNPRGNVMASVACFPMGKIISLAEFPWLDSDWSHWMQHSKYPVYEPIDTEREIGGSLRVLATSKRNPARDWLRVQTPTFTTDTGFRGGTLFEV